MLQFSEAIRLGAVLAGQAFGVFEDSAGNICALAGAFRAVGLRELTEGGFVVPDEWHWAVASGVDCPVCGFHRKRVTEAVGHLNDLHLWPRDRIADFVATLEPAAAVATVGAVSVLSKHSVKFIPA